MRLQRIGAVMRRHGYEATRNPDRIADVLLWPLLDVVTWGLFGRYLLHVHAGPTAPAPLVCGIVLWGVFRAFQRDIAVGVLAEIWSRNIVGLFATPLGIGEYLMGVAAFNLARLALLLTLIAVSCNVVAGVPTPALIVRLLPPLAVLLVTGGAVGLVVTGLILRFSTRVQSLAYGLAGVLMPLSCVFYPLWALPAPLQAASALLPTTQAFEAMRAIMQGTHAPGWLPRASAGALIALVAASVFFSHVIRTARRSGRLMRAD